MEDSLNGTAMEIRRIKNRMLTDRVISRINDDEALDDLDAHDVFVRCLDAFDVPVDERPDLIQTYNEVIGDLFHEDKNSA
jgi:exonuclease SbcD